MARGNGSDANEAALMRALDQMAARLIEQAARPTAAMVVERFLETEDSSLLEGAALSLARRAAHRAASESLRRRALPQEQVGEQLSLIPEDARPSAPVVAVPAAGEPKYAQWLDLTLDEADAVVDDRVMRERRASAARVQAERFRAWLGRKVA